MLTSTTEIRLWRAVKEGFKIYTPAYECTIPWHEQEGPFALVRTVHRVNAGGLPLYRNQAACRWLVVRAISGRIVCAGAARDVQAAIAAAARALIRPLDAGAIVTQAIDLANRPEALWIP